MTDEEKKPTIRHKIKEKLEPVFDQIGRLTRVQRLLICLVTILVLGGGYYYLVYAPRVEALNAAKNELEQKRQTLQTYKIKARSLEKYKKEMLAAQAQFDQAMKALPDKKEVPSLLDGISKSGSSAGLAFSLFQPKAEVAKEFYKEIPLSIKVSGTYHQVADFFFQVARLNRIVNIRDLSMKTLRDKPGEVEMTCSAVTYMFSEQAADPSKKGNKGKRGNKR